MKQYICLILILFTLAGCQHDGNIRTRFNFSAASYLNPDIDGTPSPVVVNLYELKSPAEFKQASYSELSNNPANVLGNNLIDRQTIEVRPGDVKDITQYVTPETRYIGIIAAYRNIDTAEWKKVIDIPDGSSKVGIAVNLQSQNLTAKFED